MNGSDTNAQRWSIHRTPNGDVSITAENNAPLFAVEQRWRLRGVGLGYYELLDTNGSTCLDVSGGSMTAASPVSEWSCNDLAPQIWKVDAAP